MKAKTKDQLRGEIIALETEREALKQALKNAKTKINGIFVAFSTALTSELYVDEHLVRERDGFDALASFVTSFFAEVKLISSYDITKDSESLEAFCNSMGFDDVTATVIKQRIQVYYELAKMVREDKSEKEIQEFIKESREAEGKE
jgi:adenylate kinase family enzyme